jgi:hypothetical protein
LSRYTPKPLVQARFVNAVNRAPLRFNNHHGLPRSCLTLVGRQKDIDGMAKNSAPQR